MKSQHHFHYLNFFLTRARAGTVVSFQALKTAYANILNGKVCVVFATHVEDFHSHNNRSLDPAQQSLFSRST